MALTQIKTDAISDDAVTGAKIADDTVAEANMANDAISLAEIKAGTDGQILTFDASGNPTYVGPGTDGQVLTSTGAGSPPAFEAAASSIGGATGVDFNDTVKVRFGTDNDLEIYHDSGNNYIKNSTGGLNISTADGSVIYLRGGTNMAETMAEFHDNGTVKLMYDHSAKFETTTDGVTVTGDITADSGGATTTLDIVSDTESSVIFTDHGGSAKQYKIGTNITSNDGQLEFKDLTASAKRLEITTGGNVKIPDSGKFVAGTDDDLEIYHTGSAGYILNSTGNLNLRTGGTLWIDNVGGTATYAKITESGSVELYYNGAKHFETTSGGARVSGKFYTEANEANGWVGHFTHEGNSNDRYGVLVYCGTDDASGTNYGMIIADGDGGTQGSITFTGGTCSYNAFTASHWCIIPSVDNPSNSSMAYAYGTLLETVSIGYTQKDDANTERGILYTVQKTQTANSKKILGTYAGSLNGGPDNHTNMHEVNVLGDGHILCNNSGGNISVGDGICSSSTAGIGQKATASPSMIIGIAQEDVTFTGTETKLVPVQFGLQQFTPW